MKPCTRKEFGFIAADKAHKYGTAVITKSGVVVSAGCPGKIIATKVYRGGKGRMKKRCTICGLEE